MKLTVLKNHVPINSVTVEIPDVSEKHEIFVGRSNDCHVVIDDSLISRHHFVIKNDGAEWFCEKLSQLGLLSIHGRTDSRLKINSGDEIKCGHYSIIVSDFPIKKTDAIDQSSSLDSVVSSTLMGQLDSLVSETPLPVKELDQTVVYEEEPAAENLVQETDEFKEDLEYPDNSLSNFNSNEEILTSENADTSLDSGDAFSSEESSQEDADSTRIFSTFVNYQLLIFGDFAPYDRFQFEDDEIFIGRDQAKCQIVLQDPEVSSVHAVLRRNINDIIVEDLNSSNGTILNGERINKARLHTGDEFIIGSTTFTLVVKSDLLESESNRLMPVEEGQVIETEEIQEEMTHDDSADLDFHTDAPLEKSILKRIWKNPQQRKKAIYALTVLMLVWVLFDEEDKNISEEAENKKTEQVKNSEVKPDDKKVKPKLSAEQLTRINVAYELGVGFFEQAKYFEALKEFETVLSLDPDHKKIQSYFEQTKVALKRLEELDAQKRAEAERIEKKKKIEELLVKAREAVGEHRVEVAESYFNQITELDPENIELGQLKLELESWQKEQERKALEEAARIAARKKMVDQFQPGKTFYLRKEWYRAILKLEEFLALQGMDEDLVKEAGEMLSDSKNQLASEVGPLLGKARSLKEGQDLKNAFEAFVEILKLEPSNSEALNEVDDIRSQLDNRSKRIYREAIISESLSLFADAKEKFLEVQQISPTDSEYYKKASDKLKNYME
jgi:pSer/pThr/pTyr-binding forkhead associated (FHA) protein